MAIDARHRDKSGEISRKHGNTLIRTLERLTGHIFGDGCGGDEKLRGVLSHPLVRSCMTYEHGKVEGIRGQAT